MKKLASSDLSNPNMVHKYNILRRGRKIYRNLSEDEYFNIMEDLSIEYYETGSPNPNELETEIISDYKENS
jgi:hypothetical protein